MHILLKAGEKLQESAETNCKDPSRLNLEHLQDRCDHNKSPVQRTEKRATNKKTNGGLGEQHEMVPRRQLTCLHPSPS